MDVQAIIEAIKENPSIVEGIFPTVVESEFGKSSISNRVEAEYKSKIGEEVSKLHSRYDEDAFSILGEKPKENEDGSKEKTYDFIKRKLSDLKRLSEMEKSLSTDEMIKKLTADLEKAKTEGGGKQIQAEYEEAKRLWEGQKQEYEGRISTMISSATEGVIKTEIANGLTGLKFNADVPESVRGIVLRNAEAEILKNAKIDETTKKVVFYGEDGKPLLNSTTYAPKTAAEVLAEMPSIKDIILKDAKSGGGASEKLDGNIKTITVDGKTEEVLEIPAGSFTTQLEFIAEAEKALLASGITRKNPKWDELKNKAYRELNVSSLPQS